MNVREYCQVMRNVRLEDLDDETLAMILCSIEEDLHVFIPDEMVYIFRTVGGLIDHAEKHTGRDNHSAGRVEINGLA